MSAFMFVAQEAVVQAAAVGLPTAADDGIVGTLTNLNVSIQELVRAVAVTLGIIFIVIAGVASGGRMSRILIAGAAAGFFIWLVFNVTSVKDKVDADINAGGPGAIVQEVPAGFLSSSGA